jgi:gamma-glutamylcyclotransferase (GGCT)/AIG2-like uncharacterized protein YtfP
MPSLLFAYGTLTPDDPVATARDGWVPDRIRGRLYDLGPYPALLDCGDPEADWVDGYVRPVGPIELIELLDPYEGVDQGLYRRVAATTEAGHLVWVYVYARPLPMNVRGPLARWKRPDGIARLGPPDSVPQFD